MRDTSLFKPDFRHWVKPYPIEFPQIQSGEKYFFTTDSGLEYEVRFGRKKDNYLGYVINFGVLDENYEEYSETNRGEIYKVVATVIEIIRDFHYNHQYTNQYEFTGEFKRGRENNKMSIRTRLYYRYAKHLLNKGWKIKVKNNKIIVNKKK